MNGTGSILLDVLLMLYFFLSTSMQSLSEMPFWNQEPKQSAQNHTMKVWTTTGRKAVGKCHLKVLDHKFGDS